MKPIQSERRTAQPWRWWQSRLPVAFGCCLVLATTYVAGFDGGWELSKSDLHTAGWWPALLDMLYFFGGLSGSWILARFTARPHIKSAFRRLRSVRMGLAEIHRIAESDTPEGAGRAVEKIRTIAFFHHRSVEDALEDWADLAPRDVAELRADVHHNQDEHIPIAPGSIAYKGEKSD